MRDKKYLLFPEYMVYYMVSYGVWQKLPVLCHDYVAIKFSIPDLWGVYFGKIQKGRGLGESSSGRVESFWTS